MPYDERTTAKIIQLVQASKDPTTTMVALGAMSPPKPQEIPALRAQVPGLVAAVQDARGGGQGPLTTANWHGFMEKMGVHIMRLPADQQQAALRTMDNIRTVGLGGRLNLAAASAQAGDLHGAAAALNGANSFLPDGHVNRFQVVGDKVRLTRTPEDGKGEAVTRDLSAEDVQKYAMTLTNPAATMEIFLNRDKLTELVRHNKASEGLTAAGHQIQRDNLAFNQKLRGDQQALRQQQDADAREQTQRDAAGVAAYSAAQKANRALADAQENGATPGTLRNLREAALAADEKWESSLLGMSQRGASATAALGESARANDDRNARSRSRTEERQAAAAGRVPFTPDERKALYEQLDSFENDPANLDPNKKPTDSTLWAAAQTMPFAMANRDLPPKVIAGVLKRYREDPNRPAQFPSSITDSRSGVTLRVPGAVPVRDQIKPSLRPPEGNDPVAQADKPATPGALTSMMRAPEAGVPQVAAPPPRNRITEAADRAEARMPPPDNAAIASQRASRNLESAKQALLLSGGRINRARVAEVAAAYGVDVEELARAARVTQ
jgi:hypothetical protein